MRKLILASLTISSSVAAQTTATRPRTAPLRGSLEQRLAQLIDAPPFNRATWGIYVVDDRGRVLYQRNADRFSVPASNTKLVVTAAAAVLLPADYRVTTSLYVNGRVEAGVLYGDLILYGRGDPTWSERCFSVDTLAPGACDSAFTAIDAIADSVGGERGGPGPEPLRRARPRDVARAQRGGGGGRSHEHHGFARLPGGALLRRSAGRVPRAPVARRHLPDPQHQPELVRGDAAQGAGPRDQRRGQLDGGARRGAPLPDRFGEDRLDRLRARGRVGARGRQPGHPARVRAAPGVHASPPQRSRVRGRAAARGPAGFAAQALRGHAAGRPGDRQDRQHRSRQQPVGLHRAAQRADRHLQRPGEWARRAVCADAGADRFGRRGNRENEIGR